VKSIEKLLADTVLNLALPADSALARGPEGSHPPVELAIEFDEAYTVYVANLDQLPSQAQLESLQALDAALAAMSGPANSELWTESAVRTHPRWSELRALAQNAATQFGWLPS
jgi:hypothetical protein